MEWVSIEVTRIWMPPRLGCVLAVGLLGGPRLGLESTWLWMLPPPSPTTLPLVFDHHMLPPALPLLVGAGWNVATLAPSGLACTKCAQVENYKLCSVPSRAEWANQQHHINMSICLLYMPSLCENVRATLLSIHTHHDPAHIAPTLLGWAV